MKENFERTYVYDEGEMWHGYMITADYNCNHHLKFQHIPDRLEDEKVLEQANFILEGYDESDKVHRYLKEEFIKIMNGRASDYYIDSVEVEPGRIEFTLTSPFWDRIDSLASNDGILSVLEGGYGRQLDRKMPPYHPSITFDDGTLKYINFDLECKVSKGLKHVFRLCDCCDRLELIEEYIAKDRKKLKTLPPYWSRCYNFSWKETESGDEGEDDDNKIMIAEIEEIR